jgi:adenine-specific DNA-methyltransferase
MANILDGLIAKIEDPAMREVIANEVNRLRITKDYGLIFERHLPETVRLFTHPIRRGVMVQDRASKDSPTWLVRRVSNGLATLVDDGNESQRPIDELVVIREFGDPIYPGLRSVDRITQGGDKAYHTVINGENFHALEALLYTHQERIDLIYIDPPYNTGDRNWTYNNNYVDISDSYRHSKWLSFIEKRIRLCQPLLRPGTGALVVTVDQREISHLGVLLDDLFPYFERQLITIVINPSGQPSSGLNRVEEYAYVVTPQGLQWGADQVDDLLIPEPEEDQATGAPVKWENLLRRGTAARRIDREDMFYPIWVDPDTRRVMDIGDPLPLGMKPKLTSSKEGWVPAWPFRSNGDEGRWRVGHIHARNLLGKGFIQAGQFNAERNSYSLTYLVKRTLAQVEGGVAEVVARDKVTGVADVRLLGVGKSKPKTVWYRSRHNSSEHGTNLLSDLIGERRFSFPKSLYAVADTVKLFCANNPDAVVLDFFAGSGTTTHAVALLNSQDQGRRQSILVTNNEVDGETATALANQGHSPGDPAFEEKGVFQYVTMPRLVAAFSGKQAISGQNLSGFYLSGSPLSDGFEENVEFLDLTYLDPDLVARGKAFESIAPLLWLKAGAVGSQIEKEGDGYAIPEEGVYGILFDIEKWQDFAYALDDRPDVTHAFIVTDSTAQYQQVVAALPPAVETTMLYEDYLRNFEVNTGGM